MARNVLTKKGKAVRFEGIPEMKAKINRLLAETGRKEGQRIGQKLKRVMMDAAYPVYQEMRDLCPVDTGLLKSSIFRAYGDETKPDVLVGSNHRIAPHSHLVEFGARGGQMPAQPFLRPGIQAGRPMAARTMATGLKKVIEETLK